MDPHINGPVADLCGMMYVLRPCIVTFCYRGAFNPRGLEAIRIQKYFKYVTNNDRQDFVY